MRRSLEKSDFYEEIIFDNKSTSKYVKEIVENWMTDLLRYKQIRVEKFKDLFSELDEIVFPIRIKDFYSWRKPNIIIVDDEGKEYYMVKTDFDYHNMENYIIGRRNSSLEPLVDREFHYKINEDKTIKLIETCAMRLKENGDNDNIVVYFSYNSKENTTKVKSRLCSDFDNVIKIKYPTISREFDKKVLAFLFECNDATWCYYDIYPIFKWITAEISDEKVSISITAEIDGEIFSEIDVVNGSVQKYTTTQIINEGEIHVNKKIFAKDLKTFLAEKI